MHMRGKTICEFTVIIKWGPIPIWGSIPIWESIPSAENKDAFLALWQPILWPLISDSLIFSDLCFLLSIPCILLSESLTSTVRSPKKVHWVVIQVPCVLLGCARTCMELLLCTPPYQDDVPSTYIHIKVTRSSTYMGSCSVPGGVSFVQGLGVSGELGQI